ncbi:hypothetical protein RB24_15260 [Herbaspirillum rubrisubalbicans]|uniref:Uncharacterized protein n=1 Tax=Herbaspirillum rubrisubalbicans TaxID=80842 RepID=A0ABX9C0I0_9BURK|nr:hypothetical protein RB24_15260 [Herbaspirillum rubrisubalbicans]
MLSEMKWRTFSSDMPLNKGQYLIFCLMSFWLLMLVNFIQIARRDLHLQKNALLDLGSPRF